MNPQKTITIHRPINVEFSEIEEEYNSLIDLSNFINKKVNELSLASNYELDKQKAKEVQRLIRKFEKLHNTWRERAKKVFEKPVLDFPVNCDMKISFSHYMNALFLMMVEANQAYNSVLTEYRTVDSIVKNRFTRLTAAISIAFAIISLVISLTYK
ncbi:MAG: hypothetical protein WDZ80_06465 [Candidatus Paceibacterota bacterium]